MATYAMTIGGSAVTPSFQTLRISTPSNGPGTLSCRYVVSAVASSPTINQELILTEDGTTIFGGYIASVTEEGVADGPTTSVVVSLTADDFNQLADRRFLGAFPGGLTITSGTTLKDALTTYIVPYLQGCSLDSGQVTGPSFAEDVIVNSFTITRSVLDLFTQITGYLWRIDASRKLLMFEAGTLSAPFNIASGDGNTVGDIAIKPTRDDFANAVFVVGDGDAVGYRDDATSVAATGYKEYVTWSPGADQAICDDLAVAILAAKLVELREVTYQTRVAGIAPGQSQTITLSARGLSGSYLVTQVETYWFSGTGVIRTVTAISGSVYKSAWREKTRDLFAGGGGTSVTVAPGIPSVVPSANVGTVLLAVMDASSSAQLDFTARNAGGYSGAIFQSDFDVYRFEFVKLVPATDNVNLLMRASHDGGSTFDTSVPSYYWFVHYVTATLGNGVFNDTSFTSAYAMLCDAIDNNVAATGLKGVNGHMDLYDPVAAEQHRWMGEVNYYHNSSFHCRSRPSGYVIAATAISAWRFYFSSGNIASGSIRCYGVRK